MAKGSPKKRTGKAIGDQVVSTMKRMLPVEIDPALIKKKEHRVIKALSEKKKETELMNAEILPRRKKIKELEGEIETLRGQVENGTEEREVKCEVRKDFKRMEIVVVRLDTGEKVEARTMTAEDRQEDIESRARKTRPRAADQEPEPAEPHDPGQDDPEDNEPELQ